MSKVRANNFTNKAGTGAPTFPYGANVTGVITATSFSGDGSGLAGVGVVGVDTTGTSTFTDVVIDGNLTVGGTQTIINTTSLEVEDKNIGIASVSPKLSDANLDGAGLTIHGSDSDKTLTWDNSNSRMAFSTDLYATRFYGDGSSLTGISVGLTTEASSGGSVTLDLTAAQDHKVTATGITTITVTGGTESESHTVRIVNSGSATVGFSTYFLFPSGAAPSLPTADGAISLISFTVHRVGAAGTQLLAGASVNFS